MITEETADQVVKKVNELQEALDDQQTKLKELREVLIDWCENNIEFLEEVRKI